jgi:hypothetical protein
LYSYTPIRGKGISMTDYTITPSKTGTGTISPSTATTVTGGNDQAVVMTPGSGFIVSAVSIDDTALTASELAAITATTGVATYTFKAVDADHTIAVTFADEPGTMTINIDDTVFGNKRVALIGFGGTYDTGGISIGTTKAAFGFVNGGYQLVITGDMAKLYTSGSEVAGGTDVSGIQGLVIFG